MTEVLTGTVPRTEQGQKVKAVALLSGGLDSTLAIHLVKAQGTEVVALNFVTVFCRCTRGGSCKSEARRVSEALGIPIKVLNITNSFLKIVKRPRHGYGKNMNPCIDCRINMFRMAGEYMREIGASFVITGEVLGQRPMSQRKEAMRIIEKEAGLEGLILRPLCARQLEPTVPEKLGLVDRQRLLDFKGRSRKGQIQLADIFQVKDYPCPAGGCLLTDPGFAYRIKELFDRNPDATLNDVQLLKVGRHLRLNDYTKLVVGRSEEENLKIENLAQEGDALLLMADVLGPLSLLRGNLTEETIHQAARLTARFSKVRNLPSVRVILRKGGEALLSFCGATEGQERVLEVAPADPVWAEALTIVKKSKKKRKIVVEEGGEGH